MSRYRYSAAQQLVQAWPALRGLFGLFGVPEWRLPIGDAVADRFVDTRTVTRSEPFQWAPELADVKVDATPMLDVWDGSVGGLPVQRVPAKNRRLKSFREDNPWSRTSRTVEVPVPVTGDYWVEGNPNPAGAWDRHVLLTCPETNEQWELIGVDLARSTCLNCAYYRDGGLVSGLHSYAGGGVAGVAQSALLFDSGDPPHRLGLAFNDYVGHDGAKEPGTGWPTCGDVFRLSEPAYERHRKTAKGAAATVVRSAREHGFLVYDRTGATTPFAGIGLVAGAQHSGSTLASLDIRLADLELAHPTTKETP
jgi:hypothetical protein